MRDCASELRELTARDDSPSEFLSRNVEDTGDAPQALTQPSPKGNDIFDSADEVAALRKRAEGSLWSSHGRKAVDQAKPKTPSAEGAA